MKLLSALFCLTVTQARQVPRQASPEASGAGDIAPECSSVPEKVCSVREVENPREECQEEYDDILDTTITRHCQEILTTTCTQTTKTSDISSAVLGTDSKIVASGVLLSPPYPRSKRRADPSPQSPPVCQSVPTKTCRETPVRSSRREVRRVCRLVLEISTVEDCVETVNTRCVLRTSTVLATQILDTPPSPPSTLPGPPATAPAAPPLSE